MSFTLSPVYTLANAWSVLKVFLTPFGAGIPTGVLAARDHAFAWQATAILYFISDVILACIFEPVLMLIIFYSRRSAKMIRFGELFKQAMQQTLARFGTTGGPFTLIMISLGADPMTGRTAGVAAGHGRIMSWLFAIAGDMIYFGILMVSTLWLDGLLGNGTLTTVIIIACMVLVPMGIEKLKRTRVSAR